MRGHLVIWGHLIQYDSLCSQCKGTVNEGTPILYRHCLWDTVFILREARRVYLNRSPVCLS